MAKPHTSLKSLLKHVKKVPNVRVKYTGKSHIQVVDLHGNVIGTIPSTPGEYRGLKNAISAMKRNGLDLRTHTYKRKPPHHGKES